MRAAASLRIAPGTKQTRRRSKSDRLADSAKVVDWKYVERQGRTVIEYYMIGIIASDLDSMAAHLEGLIAKIEERAGAK